MVSRFRRLLEEHDLGQRRFDEVQRYLAAKGVKVTTGTIVPPFCCMGKTRLSRVRTKVEHPIGIIKRGFDFAKVRYRGLKKNAYRLLVICALANLFMARRQLLHCQRPSATDRLVVQRKH
jgi:IS5 family transposase